MSRTVLFLALLFATCGAVRAQEWEDNFSRQTLDPRWTWRVPVAGPAFSWMRGPIGCASTCRSAPRDTTTGNPKFGRRPAAPCVCSRWRLVLETHVQLQQIDPNNYFLVGLMMGMSRRQDSRLGSDAGSGNTRWTHHARGASGANRRHRQRPAGGGRRDVLLRLSRSGNATLPA